jgi:hypothetical protein
VIKSPDQSHDPSVPQTLHDQAACDPGKPLGDLSKDWSSTWSPDRVNFRHATCPLISMWKTIGTVNKDNVINNITRLRRSTVAQSTATILSSITERHLFTHNQSISTFQCHNLMHSTHASNLLGHPSTGTPLRE